MHENKCFALCKELKQVPLLTLSKKEIEEEGKGLSYRSFCTDCVAATGLLLRRYCDVC